MKREFLKNLGIEDKDIIDKIMDENSTDIGKYKGELQTAKDKVTELEGQITTLTTEKTTLQEQVSELETLKTENAQLKQDKADLTTQLDTKVNEIHKNHAIESGIRDAKARNIKAVLAQLDMEKITYADGQLTGLTEQLDALKTGEDTSFLFGETAPSGTHRSTPPNNGGNPQTTKTFAEAVSVALSQK